MRKSSGGRGGRRGRGGKGRKEVWHSPSRRKVRSAKGSQKCASYDLLEKHFYSNLGEKYTSNLDDNMICRVLHRIVFTKVWPTPSTVRSKPKVSYYVSYKKEETYFIHFSVSVPVLHRITIIIMYIYYALINALSAHMIHINLNMIFCTQVEHSPTKTI